MKRKHAKRLAALGLSALMFLAGTVPAFAVWEDEAFYEAENLVENPGFEDGLSAWEVTEGEAFPDYTAYSGDLGMVMKEATIHQQIPYFLSAGEYEFKMNYKYTGNNFAILLVSIVTNEGVQELADFTNNGRREWQRLQQSISLKSDSDATIVIQTTGAFVCLDDLCFVSTESMPPATPLNPDDNIVSNPDFESGVSDWLEDNANSSLQNAYNFSYEGNHSMNVRTTYGNTAGALIPLPTLESMEYEVTAYVNCPAPIPPDARINIGFTTANSSSLLRIALPYLSIPVTESDQWYKLSFHTLPPTFENESLRIWSDQIHNFYVDSVSVTPTNYKATPQDSLSPQSLLRNSDFENGLSDWTENGAPCAFSTNIQAYSGASSVYFGYLEDGPLQNYLSQTIKGLASRTYTFSAYIKPDENLTGVGGMLQLEALGANGAVLKTASSPAVSDPTKGWQKVSVTLVSPTGTTSLRVKIGGVYCIGALYMDDLHLTAT